MYSENSKADDQSTALITRNNGMSETTIITGVFYVECVGADGEIKWTDTFPNQVTTVGRNDMLDKYFAGSAYTATWYMGLVNGGTTPTYAAGDTLASHAGWTELAAGTAYSTTATNRITISWNAAASGSKASTSTSFPIIASNTVAGALVTATQSGSVSGVLYSAGNFTGGNRSVVNTDTLNVTYTATLT
jgi:hypothetical protein